MEYIRPEMNGEDFIREVKGLASEMSPETGIIVYTYSGLDYREKSLRAGAAHYIARPQERGSFVRAIQESFCPQGTKRSNAGMPEVTR